MSLVFRYVVGNDLGFHSVRGPPWHIPLPLWTGAPVLGPYGQASADWVELPHCLNVLHVSPWLGQCSKPMCYAKSD